MADLPPPRSGCLYGTIDTWNIYDGSPNSNFFLWGGHEGKDNMLYSSSVFYYSEELWKRELVVGGPPSGFKYGACTQSGDFIYCYGGLNSNSEETGELWKLNTKNISWTRLSVNTSAGPMKKMDCGMVVYGNKLFLFGGFSALSNGLNNMVGNTNELHVFDLVRGTWSSPAVAGEGPPPCSGFSFTKVSQNQVILFGGSLQPEKYSDDVYLLSLKDMHWTKKVKRAFVQWPEGRTRHSATCLGYDGKTSQLLIIGGVGKNNYFGDMWIMDLTSNIWNEVQISNTYAIKRFLHSASVIFSTSLICEVIIFGGVNGRRGVIGDTLLLRFEVKESLSTKNWMLTEVFDSSQLGTEKRMLEKKILLELKSKELENDHNGDNDEIVKEKSISIVQELNDGDKVGSSKCMISSKDIKLTENSIKNTTEIKGTYAGDCERKMEDSSLAGIERKEVMESPEEENHTNMEVICEIGNKSVCLDSDEEEHFMQTSFGEISESEIVTSSTESDKDMQSKRIKKDDNLLYSDIELHLDEFVTQVENAITAKQKFKIRVAHIHLEGLPYSGKTAFMNHILGLPLQESTNTSDSFVVDVNPTSVLTAAYTYSNGMWKVMDYKDTIIDQLAWCVSPKGKVIKQGMHSHSDIINISPEISLHHHVIQVLLEKHDIRKIEDFQATGILYISDSRGHIEFQDRPSLMVNSPSIFIFVINTTVDIDEKQIMKYRSAKPRGKIEDTSISTQDALLQFLRSVSAIQASKENMKSHEPVVFIVGTHGSQLGQGKSSIIRDINKSLDSIISSNNFQRFVQYADCNKHKVLYLIDSWSKKSDGQCWHFRNVVNNYFMKRNEFLVEYPVNYLLFMFELKSTPAKVIKYEDCKKIAQKYEIEDKEVPIVLKILHLRMGVIQYFDVDILKDIILMKPDILYCKFCDFLQKTFLSSTVLTVSEKKRIHNGIVEESMFENLLNDEDSITPRQFICALVHFRIAAPFTDIHGKKAYFIPTVLNDADAAPLDKCNILVMPLTVTFECGHCPNGLLGMLVSHLVGPKSARQGWSFNFVDGEVYQNQITLKFHFFGEQHEICLKITSHLEVYYVPIESLETETATVCTELRKILEKCLDNSFLQLRFNATEVRPKFCLRCSSYNCNELHSVEKTKESYIMNCTNSRRVINLPKSGMYWYEEEDNRVVKSLSELDYSHFEDIPGSPKYGSYPGKSGFAVSMKGEDSEEMKVLKGCRENLMNALTFDIGWTAHQMNMVGLLSDGDYELLGNTKSSMSDKQKTATMLSSLQKKIGLNSENLFIFRDILRQKPRMYKEALEMLEVHTVSGGIASQRTRRSAPGRFPKSVSFAGVSSTTIDEYMSNLSGIPVSVQAGSVAKVTSETVESMSLTSIGSRLTMKSLIILKRSDHCGAVKKFRLLKEISSKWKTFGHLTDIKIEGIESIKETCDGDNERCCERVAEEWLKREDTSDYPATWDGMQELLSDLNLHQISEKLQEFLNET